MNIDKIYDLRKKFTIIALTGRKGSGCGTVAERLSKGFSDDNEVFRHPDTATTHNSYRKYRIVYNYAKENFSPHTLISYKKVLFLFILKLGYDGLIFFLKSSDLKREFSDSNLGHLSDFDVEIQEFEKYRHQFDLLHNQISLLWDIRRKNEREKELKNFFILSEFNQLADVFFDIIEIKSTVKRNKLLEIVGNNLRKSGKINDGASFNLDHVFVLATAINDIVKGFSRDNKRKKRSTEIVIDSLRNPLEIMFFRQRFSAFYTIAVNRTEEIRNQIIESRYLKDQPRDIEVLTSEEYSGAKTKDFYRQNVSQCIQNADIHLAFKDYPEVDKLNEKVKRNRENVSPYFSWQMQLLKFISLIDQPGIVTPSPEERCMQLAFTAKYNSGCISRQVGASITDENYAIKAIGWNNTPEGQVPCVLRNVDDLLNETGDIRSFTTYERENLDFQRTLREHYSTENMQANTKDLKGRNVCYCFKSLINSYSDGKNQVHTRSLHAEESAFLQITKYGGQGILNGKLFTTASPCELCSKKAYQLGIKVIYYIDPYPGISLEHILTAGKKKRNPTMRLFHGAIGNAYHWLYEPFMAYKDELSLILNLNIKDLAAKKEVMLSQKTNELLAAKNDIQKLVEENEKLREKLANQNTK